LRRGKDDHTESKKAGVLPDPFQNLETIHAWHLKVEQQQRGQRESGPVMIPRSVTDIAESVFNTGSMRTIYFQGNAPKVGVFYNYSLGPESVVLYYLPGTSGWGSFDPASSYRNHPIVLWNPLAQSSGVRSNRFGFNITGTAGIPIVVEACTNLAPGSWSALQSCTVTNGSIYFSDPQWTNYPGRLYRLRSP
jgi:hypothetical protein